LDSFVGKARPVAWGLLFVGVLLVPVCVTNWAIDFAAEMKAA
jgi:hypothetical protein